jgi:hypothetical protein
MRPSKQILVFQKSQFGGNPGTNKSVPKSMTARESQKGFYIITYFLLISTCLYLLTGRGSGFFTILVT